MIKKLLIILLLFLAGCSQDNLGGGITVKEFELGGEKIVVGGEPLFGGGESAREFKPEAKLEKWDNEATLRIWSEEPGGDKTATLVGDKLVWNAASGNEYRFYTKSAEELKNENGGFEYEVIFKKKPKSNIVTLKIETENLDFYYQPPLTQAEIDEGAHRPENIIGSYAVYHSSKKDNKYKTGKAFHIYRPEIIDANGKRVWGELNIENGILTVTIPQEFLDKAAYPVIVDPTFGYTTLGGSLGSTNADAGIALAKYYTPEDISAVDSISVGSYRGLGANVKFVLWEQVDASILANSVSSPHALPTSKEWSTYTYGTKPTPKPVTKYYLGYISDQNSTAYVFDSGSSGDTKHDTSNSYTTPNDWSTFSNVSAIMSIYATYTTVDSYASSTVTSSADDSFCYQDGSCFISSSNIRVGYRSGVGLGNCHAGFRFQSFGISQGVTIDSAYFVYTAQDTDNSNDNILIYAEATSTSQAFVETTSSIFAADNRSTTTASVAWTLPYQTDGLKYTSPDFATVIQELVDREDWTTDSAITILLKNNGATENHNVSSYDHSTSETAELYVYYTTVSDSTSTRRIIITE